MAKTGPKSKLSAAQVAQVSALAAQGCSDSVIASRLGVSRSTIQRIRNSTPADAPAIPGGADFDTTEALSQYGELAKDAYTRASHGADVSADIAYLKRAEEALAVNGITHEDGRPYGSSMFAELAQRAARIRAV